MVKSGEQHSFSAKDFVDANPSFIAADLRYLYKPDESLTIFDVGSCDGLDSIRYAYMFPKAKVFAFEPIPDNFRRLSQNIADYKCASIKPIDSAVSSETGISKMHYSSNQQYADKNLAESQSSSLLSPYKHLEAFPDVQFNNEITVRTITLDDFCSDNGIRQIDILHIDVQGAELMVLKGADRMINTINAIWLEVSDVELYHSQPTRRTIEQYMSEKLFVLASFELKKHFGNQLYVRESFIKERFGMRSLSYFQLRARVMRSTAFHLFSTVKRKVRHAIGRF